MVGSIQGVAAQCKQAVVLAEVVTWLDESLPTANFQCGTVDGQENDRDIVPGANFLL